MANPREYAVPGNQPPDMPWPASIVLCPPSRPRPSSCGSSPARSSRRCGTPAAGQGTRHPRLLSEGRLVVLPTVGWHADEYAALGVPFGQRGAVLDEQLEILSQCSGAGPGELPRPVLVVDDVWVEPRRAGRRAARCAFGGKRTRPLLAPSPLGSGFNRSAPVPGRPRRAPFRPRAAGATAALEMVGGCARPRPTPSPTSRRR